MAGALSRRQQARNEKALQELVHNTPGNDSCADCHARNPGMAIFKSLQLPWIPYADMMISEAWASWSVSGRLYTTRP
jgi:hypothetical protein